MVGNSCSSLSPPPASLVPPRAQHGPAGTSMGGVWSFPFAWLCMECVHRRQRMVIDALLPSGLGFLSAELQINHKHGEQTNN